MFVQPVAYAYKMHDYVVGHFIFLLIGVLTTLQMGYLQTWLLYHNALSAGVVIEDILKHARKSKERASTTDDLNSIAELRAQVKRHLLPARSCVPPPPLTLSHSLSLLSLCSFSL